MISAVTFDFGGTLVRGKLDIGAYRKRLLDYIRSLGFKGDKASLKEAVVGMFVRLEKARKNNLELRFEELCAGVLNDLGISAEEEALNRIHELYIQSFPSETISGTEKTIETLYPKYRLAMISNSTSNLPRMALEKSGLNKFFRVVVLSRDIGVRKPDPKIFRYALDNLQVKVEEALHVGNSMKHDVVGAKKAGLKAVWIKREEEVVEEPDHMIDSIIELPEIISEYADQAP